MESEEKVALVAVTDPWGTRERWGLDTGREETKSLYSQ